MILPMSLLKFSSLLSKPSWIKISSTLNVCSMVRSVSFRAFLPKLTEKRCRLVLELKDKCIRTVRLSCYHCHVSAHAVLTGNDLTSYPSGKQWAAVRTQQGEIRVPLQRKILSLDFLRQNMVATHGWDSTVATFPSTIVICFPMVGLPHLDSAAGGWNKVQNKREKKQKKHGKATWWVQWGSELICLWLSGSSWRWSRNYEIKRFVYTNETSGLDFLGRLWEWLNSHVSKKQWWIAQYSQTSCLFFRT